MAEDIYLSLTRGLYKIEAVGVTSEEISPDKITSGSLLATFNQVMNVIQSGKTGFNNTDPGYILGLDDGVAKFYIGNTTNYLNWDGTTLTVTGSLVVSSIDIPDTMTANSFHVDSSGNAWWGATTLGSSVANILNTGAAVFKSIQIGGTSLQYTVGDGGIFSYGDGSDGAGTADGSTALTGATLAANVYTLTRDVYYTTLTISTGVTIKPTGYRIFCSTSLTINGTGTISGIGNAGGAGGTGGNGGNGIGQGGTNGTAGAAGSALADGYLKGSLAGKTAGSGGAGGFNGAGTVGTVGSDGSNTSNSIGSDAANGTAGGAGGTFNGAPATGGGAAGGAGGIGGTVSASNVKLIANWHLSTLLDVSSTGSTVKFDNSASAASSGGGGGGTGSGDPCGGGGGGGGGSGSSGRILAIYAKAITISSSSSITAAGGAGGNGGNGGNSSQVVGLGGSAGGGGGGGGGTGGNGGQIILIYNSLTNDGVISVAGGAAGTAGTGGIGLEGGRTGNAGTTGNNGNSGTSRSFQLSL